MTDVPKSPILTWKRILEFYDGFPKNGWWEHLKPFRHLVVSRIIESPFCELLSASQSHETLVISVIENWPERLDHPHITVSPLRSEALLQTYRSTDELVEELRCTLEETWVKLEPMLRRLVEHRVAALSR
jgi:hypothetical protein